MSAVYTRRTLLTVVCEASIEERVVADAQRLGAHGYTASDARGAGDHGRRDGGWPMSGNVRIEILCEAGVADAIAAHLQAKYFADYAMVCYLSDVSVLRSGKF
jgi:hypothetical protein